MLKLGLKSLLNRRFVSLLTIASIALSVCLIVGVDRLRNEARAGFANSADGIDLIVASRGNPVQILLATVFGVGSTGNAITWDTYEAVRDLDTIDWAVPISMGDNFRGFPVIGTSADYFSRFRHSGGTPLSFATGRAFGDAAEAVLGAEVSRRFDYGEGKEIVLAHGAGDVSFHMHDDEPFTVVGVLEPTGTAVDRMVLVSLKGFDALHDDSAGEAPDPLGQLLAPGAPGASDAQAPASPDDHEADHGAEESHEDGDDHDHGDDEGHDHGDGHDHDPDADDGHDHGDGHDHDHGADDGHDHGDEHDHGADDGHDHGDEHDQDHGEHEGHDHDDGHDHGEHEAEQINAIYLGLVDRKAVLGLQRYFSEYTDEPLTAVMPNVALLELWSITGTAEAALSLMALAVALAGMLGLLAMLSAALDARRREFAVLRSVGATPWRIMSLIVIEAVLLTSAGLLVGYVALMAAIAVFDPILVSEFGLRLGGWWPSNTEWQLMLAIFVAGLVASLIPAIRVYRITLSDGLSSGH